MSAIRRLNKLLRDELSPVSRFEHRWLHTESPELLHPMIVCDTNGKDELEYVCSCGVDVVIHAPYCRSLVAARKKVELRPLLSINGIFDRWLVCRLHHPSRHEWAASFGTHVQFPENGKWHPIEVGRGKIGLPQGVFPTEEDTWNAIHLIKDAESTHIPTWSYELERASEKREKAHTQLLRDMIKDDAGFVAVPGTKGSVSYPSK